MASVGRGRGEGAAAAPSPRSRRGSAGFPFAGARGGTHPPRPPAAEARPHHPPRARTGPRRARCHGQTRSWRKRRGFSLAPATPTWRRRARATSPRSTSSDEDLGFDRVAVDARRGSRPRPPASACRSAKSTGDSPSALRNRHHLRAGFRRTRRSSPRRCAKAYAKGRRAMAQCRAPASPRPISTAGGRR